MFEATPLIAHLGHWFEAAMFAPAAVIVVVASLRSIAERRSPTPPEEKSR